MEAGKKGVKRKRSKRIEWLVETKITTNNKGDDVCYYCMRVVSGIHGHKCTPMVKLNDFANDTKKKNDEYIQKLKQIIDLQNQTIEEQKNLVSELQANYREAFRFISIKNPT